MNVHTTLIKEMYDYLRSPQTTAVEPADGAFVFCREDPLLAQRVGELFHDDLIDYVMFTGGLGKDSGENAIAVGSEAVYQAMLLSDKYGVSGEDILVEPLATNGAQNSEFGMNLILESNKPYVGLTAVVHPTSLRRIKNCHERIVRDEFPDININWQWTSTNRYFDYLSKSEQKEAVAEMNRLIEWPNNGWTTVEEDMPEELKSYVLDLVADGFLVD